MPVVTESLWQSAKIDQGAWRRLYADGTVGCEGEEESHVAHRALRHASKSLLSKPIALSDILHRLGNFP